MCTFQTLLLAVLVIGVLVLGSITVVLWVRLKKSIERPATPVAPSLSPEERRRNARVKRLERAYERLQDAEDELDITITAQKARELVERSVRLQSTTPPPPTA